MKAVILDGTTLTLEDIERVARHFAKVEISPNALRRVLQARKIVDEKANGEKLYYAINTGFGDLCNVRISKKDLAQLQTNLIRSHAVGVGDLLSESVVRAMMLIRVNTLLQGHSGIRPELVELLRDFLNYRIHPLVPSQGSVGASGDLAPLAHMTLPLIGEGEVFFRGEKMPAKIALKKTKLHPLKLQAKEGLALINGTSMMCGVGTLALLDGERLATMADISAAVSLEALKGVDHFLREEIHQMRPHPGQMQSAANMRKLIKGSRIVSKFRNAGKVQDAYSLRCIPQVHGASRDAIRYCRRVLEIEVNSVTDNPLVLPKTGEILSGGNFHGQPVALAMDFLSIAVAEIANIAESRVSRLINSRYSDLPPFLVKNSGLNSGFMVAQYTMAALVSENKVLAHPASVDSIPTCAGQEDHVSMGSIAARKAAQIVGNVMHVIAIEFLAASQGLEFLLPLKSSPALEAVHELIRSKVKPLENDRRLDLDIQKVVELMQQRKILETVKRKIGVLS